MSSSNIARQWFVRGDGIDRHVISADIQRYLGNDATVRPGLGNGEEQGVQGYWIKAYRTLTSAMIADLQQDSKRWRQEQRQTGTQEYAGSTTQQHSTVGRTTNARDRDSPSVEGPYGLPSRERLPADRIPADRMPADRMSGDRMQIDPPAAQLPPRGYPPADRGYQSDGRPYGFPPLDNRNPYQQDASNVAGYGSRPNVPSSAYDQQPRYAPVGYPQENVPSSFVRQGDYMVPGPQYESAPGINRQTSQYGQGGYGQPPPPQAQGRDPRDVRYPPPEFGDPRYAYPSPATTVSSVVREPVVSLPPQQSYGNAPPQQYDLYGGRTAPTPFGMPQAPSTPSTARSGSDDIFGRGSDGGRSPRGDRRQRRH